MKLIALLLGLSTLVNAQSLLKDAVSFRLGASVNPRMLVENEAYRNIASNEFTSLTAENHMKMMLIHPAADRLTSRKAMKLWLSQRRRASECMDTPWFGIIKFRSG